MAWQSGTTAASGAYRDLLTKLVAFATSKHISAIAVNNAGTGYTVGDLLTVTHAGAYLDATIEVLTVGGGGEILTAAIRNSGAFSNRVSGVAINAAGSGYAAGDIVRIEGGTYTEWAKVRVDTVSTGAAATISVFETGGAYSSVPAATGAVTNSDIGTGTGTGLTVDTTMTGLIGTTNIAATGGTGASATFDLTLTDTGWSAVHNHNDYSFNSITNEKEIILQGTVSGGDEPFVGIRSYTATVGIDTRWGWLLVGMDDFNPSLAFTAQLNIGPQVVPSANTGVCYVMFDDDQDYWFRVNGRSITSVVKAIGGATITYQTAILGLMNPFGTATEAPYPLYLSGSTSVHNRAPDAGGFLVTGPTEVFADAGTTSPAFFRRASDGVWTRVINSTNGAAVATSAVYPIGTGNNSNFLSGTEDFIGRQGGFTFFGGVSLISGGAATILLMPSIGTNDILLVPATVFTVPASAGDNDSETTIRGEIDGLFWIPGTKSDGNAVLGEDIIEQGGFRYRIFYNAHRTERYSFFAIKEN